MRPKTFKELRLVCQPVDEVSDDTLVDRLIYRKLSIYLTYFFVHLGFSANVVTLLGLFVAIAGVSMFIVSPNIGVHFIGIILLQIFCVMDNSDGEVARYWRYEINYSKEDNNISGAFMDNICHYILDPLILFFFGYRSIYHFPDWTIPILILSFFTAIAGIGLPNLVMSEMIVNRIRTNDEVMDNSRFRNIAHGKINIFLNQENQMPMLQKILFGLVKLYKGMNVTNIVSLVILIELLFIWIGYLKIAMYLRVGVLMLLAALLTCNFIRTFKRNYNYLNRSF